jgi:hypothetical protein
MTDLRKAAQMALKALEDLRRRETDQVWLDRWNDTIDDLRAALEQPKEVVECLCGLCKLERP